ncbi:unnamed protein product, partial [Ascophyllum nodosum]
EESEGKLGAARPKWLTLCLAEEGDSLAFPVGPSLPRGSPGGLAAADGASSVF